MRNCLKEIECAYVIVDLRLVLQIACSKHEVIIKIFTIFRKFV